MKKRNINWDAVYRSNYESTAFWDIYWLRSARSLIVSAKELEPKVMELWENYRARMKDNRIRLKEDHYQEPRRGVVAVQTADGNFSVFELLGDDPVDLGDNVFWFQATPLGSTLLTTITQQRIFEVYFQNHEVPESQLKKQLLIN